MKLFSEPPLPSVSVAIACTTVSRLRVRWCSSAIRTAAGPRPRVRLVTSKKVITTPRVRRRRRDRAASARGSAARRRLVHPPLHRRPRSASTAAMSPAQVGQAEAAGEVGDRPAAVARQEVEDCADRRREAADHQVAGRGRPSRSAVLSNRLRRSALARSSSSILPVSSRLTVLQLLVDRLQLLLRGLELLVGGLQLLVDRDHLLVRGFQLLERRSRIPRSCDCSRSRVSRSSRSSCDARRRPAAPAPAAAAASRSGGGPASVKATRKSGSSPVALAQRLDGQRRPAARGRPRTSTAMRSRTHARAASPPPRAARRAGRAAARAAPWSAAGGSARRPAAPDTSRVRAEWWTMSPSRFTTTMRRREALEHAGLDRLAQRRGRRQRLPSCGGGGQRRGRRARRGCIGSGRRAAAPRPSRRRKMRCALSTGANRSAWRATFSDDAEEQEAARAQRVVEQRDDLLLQLRRPGRSAGCGRTPGRCGRRAGRG